MVELTDPEKAKIAAEEEYRAKQRQKAERKKTSSLAKGCLGIIVILIVLGAVVALSGNDEKSSPKSSRQPATGVVENSPAAVLENTPDENGFGDGAYVVGEDIQPGTYRTRAASSGCYYARLSGFGGSLDEIIANANTDAPAVVTIEASDKGFQSTRCGRWSKDLSAITSSQTTFREGIYMVGVDIEPGTYKNTGGQGCYYARLNGFGGTLGEIIANSNTDAPAIVTIAASDKGFQSTRCGEWSRQ